MPWIDENKYSRCKLCIDNCPVPGTIYIKQDNNIYRCRICITECPKNAIRPNYENSLLKRQYTLGL